MGLSRAAVLTKENYQAEINSYSDADWKPLLDMIPRLEQTRSFGEMGGSVPRWDENEIVSEFRNIVYRIPIIISFDWGSWDEGRKITGTKNFDFDTIDIPTKCQIITAIVRNDRFFEGALIGAMKSGLILKILMAIQKQINQKKKV